MLLQTRHEHFLISTPTHFAVMRLSLREGDDKLMSCMQSNLIYHCQLIDIEILYLLLWHMQTVRF